MSEEYQEEHLEEHLEEVGIAVREVVLDGNRVVADYLSRFEWTDDIARELLMVLDRHSDREAETLAVPVETWGPLVGVPVMAPHDLHFPTRGLRMGKLKIPQIDQSIAERRVRRVASPCAEHSTPLLSRSFP